MLPDGVARPVAEERVRGLPVGIGSERNVNTGFSEMHFQRASIVIDFGRLYLELSWLL